MYISLEEKRSNPFSSGVRPPQMQMSVSPDLTHSPDNRSSPNSAEKNPRSGSQIQSKQSLVDLEY